MNDSQIYTRQLDLVKPQDLDFPIAIIGAGGIGSWATLTLAKMGCRNLTVYDFDTVEIENTPSQFYEPRQVGKEKVAALYENVYDIAGMEITTVSERWQVIQRDLDLTDLMLISAVDSMQERQNIWTLLMMKLSQHQPHRTRYYIDARMEGEFLNVNIVDLSSKESADYYLRSLIPQTKVEPEVCTAKSIVYNTFFCGGLIASIVKKLAKGQPVRNDISFDIVNLSAD